jgi:site-specific recombinase XerD
MGKDTNLRYIQDALRHDNIQTTQIYTQIPSKDIADFLDSKQDLL